MGGGYGNICKKKSSISDYGHTRPRMLQKEECDAGGLGDTQRRIQVYHGHSSTAVTAHLQPKPPTHALHPRLADAPTPNHNRKTTEITRHPLGLTPIRRHDSFSPPDAKFHRIVTDVTQKLRNVVIPDKPSPTTGTEYHGRIKTYVTDPSINDFHLHSPS